MQIRTKTFNALAVVVGLLLTAGVWHHMASNPRWASDKGPGVGKLPREIVAGFLSKSYDEGQPSRALALYMAKNASLRTGDAEPGKDGMPVKHTVKRVVAEGLNVAVWYCLDGRDGTPGKEMVDFFRTRNGRIVERERATLRELPSATCERKTGN